MFSWGEEHAVCSGKQSSTGPFSTETCLSLGVSGSSLLPQDTGDGAGILCGIPDKFMRRVASELSVELPPPRQRFGCIHGISCASFRAHTFLLVHSYGPQHAAFYMPVNVILEVRSGECVLGPRSGCKGGVEFKTPSGRFASSSKVYYDNPK